MKPCGSLSPNRHQAKKPLLAQSDARGENKLWEWAFANCGVSDRMAAGTYASNVTKNNDIDREFENAA